MNHSLMASFQKYSILSWLPLAGLLSGASAVAQDSTSVSENDFLADMPIVLSVSRLPQRLDETPGAVTILDRDMIRRSGARDVVDLFRMVPGFQVSNSFERVAPSVSYHGAYDAFSNRIQLLIDGRSAYSPLFIGSIGAGLQNVALEDIERIEVLRGSNSAAYGSRAIQGVVNIITRHTADTLGKQVSVSVGENGVRDAQAQLGWGNERATYRLTVDRHTDAGLTGSNGSNQVNRVNFRSDWHPSATDDIQLRLGDLSINAGKGFPGNIDDDLRSTSFNSNFVQVDWQRSFNVDEDLALSFSHSQEVYQDRFPYPLRVINPAFGDMVYTVDSSGQASSDSVSLQHSFRYSPKTRVVWGGELRSERVVSEGMYNTTSAFVTDFTRLFGNLEWRAVPSVVVNAGAMFEKSSATGESFSPRLVLNWHVAEGQTLRMGISKALRPPSTYEKFANVHYIVPPYFDIPYTVASGNVVPEIGRTRELGYLAEFPKWRLGLDVRAFYEQLDGMIRQKNDTSPKDYINQDGFSVRGLEYQVKWQPWTGAKIIFNQTYTEINTLQAFVSIGGSIYPAFYDGIASAAPMLSNSIAYFQKLPGDLNLTLTHTDNGTASLIGSGVGSQVAMTRTDLRLAKSLRWGTKKGELALVLQNLGLPYQDFDPKFTFERRAFVTLRLED